MFAAFLKRSPETATVEDIRHFQLYLAETGTSNRRLISADATGVTFKWKDYWIEGPGRYRTMTLSTHEFIRCFLMYILPEGLYRIRHYGLLANGNRVENVAHARTLPAVPTDTMPAEADADSEPDQPRTQPKPCPCCGGRMIIIEIFARGCQPKHRLTPSAPAIRMGTS